MTSRPNLGARRENREALLEARIRQLEQTIKRIPSRWPVSSTTLYHLVIDRGNTLSDGSTLGIKYSSSPIATVPSLYDPTVTSSFIDGIGRATLYVNGVAQTNKVLVVNDGRGDSTINYALFANDRCQTTGLQITIPLVSDATQSVSCYTPYFL